MGECDSGTVGSSLAVTERPRRDSHGKRGEVAGRAERVNKAFP